jgi:hypothetical protein
MEMATIDSQGRRSVVLAAPAVEAAPVGRFHCWWRGDPLPALPPLPGLSVEPAQDWALLARLSGLDETEVAARVSSGHLPWLARVAGDPVGWGWCATTELDIGELGITRSLPPRNRYLWDFITVPLWRGRRIYPRLLQAIVARSPDADRFWIGHDQLNTASAHGIARAGFTEVGLLYASNGGGYALLPTASPSRTAAAAALFGVPIIGGSFAGRTSPDAEPRTTFGIGSIAESRRER